MRAQQSGFDFDLFDIGGFSFTKLDDYEAREARRQAQQEREEREYQRAKAEREEARWRANQDPWTVLGVNRSANKAEIRAAWTALCKQHHPDAGGSLAAMQAVNRAYQALKKR